MKELHVTDSERKKSINVNTANLQQGAGMTKYGQRAGSGLRYSGIINNVALY
jgi:hypothetical protein